MKYNFYDGVKQRNTQKLAHTSAPWVGLQSAIQIFKGSKTIIDRLTTSIDRNVLIYLFIYLFIYLLFIRWFQWRYIICRGKCNVNEEKQVYVLNWKEWKDRRGLFTRIEIRLRAGRLRFDTRQRMGFFPRHRVQTGSGTHPFSYPMGSGGLFPRG
jgi:hypothetical protein